jgi:hypothetical protein
MTITSERQRWDTRDTEFSSAPMRLEIEILNIKVNNTADIILSIILLSVSLSTALFLIKEKIKGKKLRDKRYTIT